MNNAKQNKNGKQKRTSGTSSDKTGISKDFNVNLVIDKNQIIFRNSDILLVAENSNMQFLEVQPPVSIVNIKAQDDIKLDDDLIEITKPVADATIGKTNSKFRVKIEDRIFEIDRKTLYNKSTFFRNILLKRELSNDTPFTLESVKAAAVEPIFQWMHSGEIAIGPENIGNVLEVAIKLEIDDLIKTCLQFRDLMLESAGLMRVYILASKYGMNDIKDDALNRMRAEFMKLAKSSAFLNFDIDQLCLLLDDSHLHIDSEMNILDSCVHWLTSNWENRQVHFIRAFDCVQFPLLSTTTLVTVATGGEDNESQINKNIWKHDEIQKKVSDALTFKAGLQCGLSHKVSHLKPKLRKHMKRECSTGSLAIKQLDIENQAVTTLQAGLRGYNSRKLLENRNEAAKTIQVWYRQNLMSQKTSSPGSPPYILVLDK